MTNPFVKTILKFKTCNVICPTDGSHKAYLAAQLFKAGKKPFLVLVKDQKTAVQYLEDLSFFMPELKKQVVLFPGYHIMPFKSLSYHKDTSTARISVLSRIMNAGSKPLLIITSVETVLQKLVPQKSLIDFEELIMTNEEIDRDQVIEKLESGGYTRTGLVEDPGEYSVRGGLLDIFIPGRTYPVRIEFFGDMVESIRDFNVYTQRAVKGLSETVIIPATETIIDKENQPHVLARLRSAASRAGLDAQKTREYVNKIREFGRFPGIESMQSIVYERPDSLADYLPKDTIWMLDDPIQLEASAQDAAQKAQMNYQDAISEQRLCVAPEMIAMDWEDVKSQVQQCPKICLSPFEMNEPDFTSKNRFVFEYKDNTGLEYQLKQERSRETPLAPFVKWIERRLENQDRIVCAVSQESQANRLLKLLQPYGISPGGLESFDRYVDSSPGLYILIGSLSSGFHLPESRLAIVTEDEIFRKKRIRRVKSSVRDLKTRFIAPEELKEGDFVVHIEHGIGEYLGLCSLEVNRISQDFILLRYQDDDKLYLPVDRIEMIGKYIGVDGYTPVLDKIGGKSWTNSKTKAKEEVEKLAADLLELYAKRKVNQGFRFSRPDNYYNDFEATFPYEETKDQLKAIDDVHLDMESKTPMDRLVCGDVGYGKTEVAVRAAFKAVNDGKQVALVVPTTILAEQHLTTFRQRFENYPVNIECLSRFRSKKEQNRIVKDMKKGLVDIAIGTHRILQKDIEFKSLGLLIIDEEQRFGVKHKEMLKKKRSSVDVLALTATPIPRTLHLSLTGMRDISVISTPPADRQPIVSYISKYEDATVKDAILKEMKRNGQIFFVHNNIKTINKTAESLKKLVPQARIGIAHGRLSESELERTMLKFVGFEIDILVCTTIIESGLDIASANTMIINKAERFGLSQIYQLRGRIGRGEDQAFAYLFISNEGHLTKDAQKRLAALMEYKDLGSGFQIAMKDLQIRGAGSALGASQSGHIAAVGYDMFLKLLDQAVKDMKGEEVVEPLEPEINMAMSSGFPDYYIESVEQRLTLYRRLSRLVSILEINDFKKELIDRYGKLPKDAENMLIKIMFRVFCIKAGIKRLDLTPVSLALSFSQSHRTQPMPDPGRPVLKKYPFSYVNPDTIRFALAKKRNSIAKAVLETRNILKELAGAF